MIGNDPNPEQCIHCRAFTYHSPCLKPFPVPLYVVAPAWTSAQHSAFPARFQGLVRAVLLAALRHCGAEDGARAPPWLPTELLSVVFSFMPADAPPDSYEWASALQNGTCSETASEDGISSMASLAQGSEGDIAEGRVTPPPYVGSWRW